MFPQSNRTKSVIPIETAHYEPAHLDLRSLQIPLFFLFFSIFRVNVLKSIDVSNHRRGKRGGGGWGPGPPII